MFIADLDNDTIASLINPFGGTAFSLETRYWTVADKNTEYVTLFTGQKRVLWNRLLWLSIAMVILSVTCWRFSFASGKGRLSRWLNEAWEELTGKFAGSATPASLKSVPSVTRNFGWFASFRNVLAQAKVDFVTTVRSPVFIVVGLFGLINTLGSLSVATSAYGLESLPVTYNQIEVIRGSLYILSLIHI